MRAGGTYGGNMELVAFARMRSLDIWVHQGGMVIFVDVIMFNSW